MENRFGFLKLAYQETPASFVFLGFFARLSLFFLKLTEYVYLELVDL